MRLERLLARLDAAATSSTGAPKPLLICAPAGYGKTKLLNAWLETQNPERLVRLRCYPGAVRTIWKDLLRVLAEHIGKADADGMDPHATDPLAELHDGLRYLSEPLTLEIDDYHLATSPENDLALLDLINPKLRLIVVARRVTLLDSPLAARRVPMTCVTAADLAYRPDEAYGYAERFGLPPEAQLQSVIGLADGWPLAIRAALGPTVGTKLSHDGAVPKRTMDPFAALNRFTWLHLESLGPTARQAFLASAVIDVVDHAQIEALAQVPPADAKRATDELTELGLLVSAPSGDSDEFCCHSALRLSLYERALRELSDDERAVLQRSRAKKIASRAPLSAVQLYLAAESYEDAEIEFSKHFVTITDEREECLRALYTVPNEALDAHPTFLAARLFLEFSDPNVSPNSIWLYARKWVHASSTRMQRPVNDPHLRTSYMVQGLVQARFLGDLPAVKKLASQLQAQLVSSGSPLISRSTVPGQIDAAFGSCPAIGSGSYPLYYLELGTSWLAIGDATNARRAWQKLQQYAEALIEQPWYGFPSESNRTVTDVESGQRWKLAALYERSLTEALEGDMTLAAELLNEADAFGESTGAVPAGLSWVSGEAVRAHLSAGQHDPETLRAALDAVEPIFDRIELWPTFLISEAEFMRSERGVDWALQHFESRLGPIRANRKVTVAWHTLLSRYQAMLNTLLGRFSESKRILNTLSQEEGGTLLERARLALFMSNNVKAAVLAEQAGDQTLTMRQQVDRLLIISVAAWRVGNRETAINAFDAAMSRASQLSVQTLLYNFPHATLLEVATAAQQPTAISFIEQTPEPVRARVYERLTEMEVRTLDVISQLGSINEAAEDLFVTPATVKKHLSAVYRKLGVKGREEAVLLATRMSVLPLTREPAQQESARGTR